MNDDPIWMVYYCASCIVINEIWNASSGLPQILAHITNIHIHQQDPLTRKSQHTSYQKIHLSDIWWWWMTEDDRYLMMMDEWRWWWMWWWWWTDEMMMMMTEDDDDVMMMVKDYWWWWMADNCMISLLHALR